VFVHGYTEFVAISAHRIIGQCITLPGLNVRATATGYEQTQRDQLHNFLFHSYFLARLPASSFSTSAAYCLAVSLP